MCHTAAEQLQSNAPVHIYPIQHLRKKNSHGTKAAHERSHIYAGFSNLARKHRKLDDFLSERKGKQK